MLKRLVWIFIVLSAVACDDATVRHATPAGPAGPVAPAVRPAFTIASGADGSPVRGATVVVEGQPYQSDDTGQVTVAASLSGWAIDVEAAGFLPRRTTTFAGQTVALWPVASREEADAIRQMVYERGGALDGVLYPPDSGPFYIALEASYANDPVVARAWNREGAAFGSMFGLEFRLSDHFQYETNEIAVTFTQGTAAGCAPVPGWGFCRSHAWYKTFAVPAGLATDPATIRRVLASWFLGPNPLPGFMNPETPGDSLSPLEVQTIRMILRRPFKNRWPDDDRW